MRKRPIKVLIAKPGLDGHETGAKVVARALADAGMDVIYTGTRQLPNMIVIRALQEKVDIIGLSMLSGSHKELCSQVISMLKEQTARQIPIVLGGVIPDCDVPELKSMGIKEVFGPGTRLDQIISCVSRLSSNKKDIQQGGDN
jgi:methylmalonyl-CoA mutase, C-terminal domain